MTSKASLMGKHLASMAMQGATTDMKTTKTNTKVTAKTPAKQVKKAPLTAKNTTKKPVSNEKSVKKPIKSTPKKETLNEKIDQKTTEQTQKTTQKLPKVTHKYMKTDPVVAHYGEPPRQMYDKDGYYIPDPDAPIIDKINPCHVDHSGYVDFMQGVFEFFGSECQCCSGARIIVLYLAAILAFYSMKISILLMVIVGVAILWGNLTHDHKDDIVKDTQDGKD